MIMADQDQDGSHIKGLGLNLFQDQWNSLSTLDNFIGFMNTPILKAKKGGKELLFYNDGEYRKWKDENDTKGQSYSGPFVIAAHDPLTTFCIINNGSLSPDG